MSRALPCSERQPRTSVLGFLTIYLLNLIAWRWRTLKILWHDGIGMSLYAKRLERGRFKWPSPADGTVAITLAQLAYMLDGIDWRNPVRTWRPEAAG
jgi:transposase